MIYFELIWTFFKIGLFTFGGGYAMIPLIQQEVLNHKWLQMEQIIDFIAISESTPGPFALNIATFVGTNTGGTLGALCATLGVVLPSFIIILIVAKFYASFKSSKTVQGLMYGLRPAAIGMILTAVVSVGTTVFFPNGLQSIDLVSTLCSLAIFGLCMFLSIKKAHPILLVVISAIMGIIFGYLNLY